MRLAVISDTHGRYSELEKFIEQRRDSDLILHLGDGYDEFCRCRDENPSLPLVFVKGNNDFSSRDPEDRLFDFAGKRVLATHGHRHGVKHDGGLLLGLEAKRKGADIVLFGHTHVACCEYRDGVYYLNPGSPTFPYMTSPSYGTVDVTDAGVVCFLTEL